VPPPARAARGSPAAADTLAEQKTDTKRSESARAPEEQRRHLGPEVHAAHKQQPLARGEELRARRPGVRRVRRARGRGGRRVVGGGVDEALRQRRADLVEQRADKLLHRKRTRSRRTAPQATGLGCIRCAHTMDWCNVVLQPRPCGRQACRRAAPAAPHGSHRAACTRTSADARQQTCRQM
jgi:hypothetical protein